MHKGAFLPLLGFGSLNQKNPALYFCSLDPGLPKSL